jgi:hypothetical protein
VVETSQNVFVGYIMDPNGNAWVKPKELYFVPEFYSDCSNICIFRSFMSSNPPVSLPATRIFITKVSQVWHVCVLCSLKDFHFTGLVALSVVCTLAETKIGRLEYSNSPPSCTVVIRILRFFCSFIFFISAFSEIQNETESLTIT